VAFSQESSPRESENKATSPENHDAQSTAAQNAATPPGITVAPTIQIRSGKHAEEPSHCTQPKDWKKWGYFGWCRTWEWLDAEKIIAVFTVILGVATWKLWRSTDALVRGAEVTAERQLRAYVGVRRIYFDKSNPGSISVVVEINNFGQTPANYCSTNIFLKIGPTDGSQFPGLIREGFDNQSTLMPSHERTVICHLNERKDTAPNILRAINDGKLAIYVIGAIRYQDFAGQTQYTDIGYLGFGSRLKTKSPFIHAVGQNRAT
jgi:hypothetical protein